MKRTPLKPRSAKRAKYYREVRIPLVQKILSDHPWCQAGQLIEDPDHQCQGRSMDVHERKKRSQGGSLEDPHNLLAVCRLCHGWIDAHPAHSYDLGLLIHGWDEVTPLGGTHD